MRTLRQLFTEHPASVGESYWQHAARAAGFAGRMLAAAALCLVHAAVPGCCQRSASRRIAVLARLMGARAAAGRSEAAGARGQALTRPRRPTIVSPSN